MDDSLAAELVATLARARDDHLLAPRRKRSPRAGGRSATSLSKRESEVHELLCEGLSNKEIARALFISEVTVKVHVRRILAKLGLRSRTEVVAHAALATGAYATSATGTDAPKLSRAPVRSS